MTTKKLRGELKKAKKWAFDNLVGNKVYNKNNEIYK